MGIESKIFFGNNPMNDPRRTVRGEIVHRDGLDYYKLNHYDRMPAFFMTLSGAGNHWMFISSNGALTAGRREPENALFPYITDDKITDNTENTGVKTIFRIHRDGKDYLWEPFSIRYNGLYDTENTIYKSVYGNILEFEERNLTLGCSYAYRWQFSDKYGFVKTSRISNFDEKNERIMLLDGLQNVLPFGVEESMQLRYSTLVDAYKKAEIDPDSGVGIFYLSSIPTDRAEPSEGLKCTTIWSAGLENPLVLLSARQLDAFRMGNPIEKNNEIRGQRGAYFLIKEIEPGNKQEISWIMVSELEQDQAAIFSLKESLQDPGDLIQAVKEDLDDGTRRLVKLVSQADGIQVVRDKLISARHFSNVMFNIMRGGIFGDQYFVNRQDVIEHIKHFNSKVSTVHPNFLSGTGPRIEHYKLIQEAEKNGDTDLIRLCYEYLPLIFGRRHGDPSRPWNRFYIEDRDADGNFRINYQGNWRDIFQNWETLSMSFPGFVEGMIFRFLNASTADGYNPYRVTNTGIDWETIDPDDPWSNIGYWGDHQIIYLLRLLEISEHYCPGKLTGWLTQDLFAYANVPYRIKPYAERLADSRNTILYDEKESDHILRRIKQFGADAKLLWLDDEVYKVNMAEKLLVSLLAKLSNFVADGGIWLNTQRPEWNDANNALVGSGLSMVTLYYLFKHITFLQDLFQNSNVGRYNLSKEVSTWLHDIRNAFSDHQSIINEKADPGIRKSLLDALGRATDNYQHTVYEKGFSGAREMVKSDDLDSFYSQVLKFITASISRNQRKDRLFHAYNLMKVTPEGGISVSYLYEMLEGQVAVLTSGYLNGKQSLELLDALKESSMYRSDQNSYTLYPDRQLKGFMQKNRLSEEEIAPFDLITKCLKENDHRLVKPIGDGSYQFNGKIRNSKDVEEVLAILRTKYNAQLVDKERDPLIALFENKFDHQSFTGRSGTFFKYEGLGCIYWHMVAKLRLAVQEVFFVALERGESDHIIKRLSSHYREITEGLGLHKRPDVYGAFPIDPYSHTPKHTGVQQPGMTGQVKEDILSRWGELGLRIRNGKLTFSPVLLQKQDFISAQGVLNYITTAGIPEEIPVPDNSLAFTYCQAPVVYQIGKADRIQVDYTDGKKTEQSSLVLSQEVSAEIFNRSGQIKKIKVVFNSDNIGIYR